MMNRILSYPEAINEALMQEMENDDKTVLMGEGVDDPKRILGTTKGLVERFGNDRVFDTPIAEEGMTGVAIGMAMNGFKVVHTHIRMDFLLLCMNQLMNIAAKSFYMWGGHINVPIVIRAMIGKSWGQGPQHSQSLYSLFLNVPGIKVIAPATPYDAKGMLIEAIRDENPVLFVEHRHLYYQKGHVPEETYTVPFKQVRHLNEIRNSRITLIGVSQMAIECLRASKLLEEYHIISDVVSLNSLNPLNIEYIIDLVKKTKNVIFVDCAWQNCGLGAEVFYRLKEAYDNPIVKFKRMGFAQTTCPTTPSLEKEFYPNAYKIAEEAFKMLEIKEEFKPKEELEIEEIEFKGPF